MKKNIIIISIFITIVVLFFQKENNENKTILIGSSLPKSGIMENWGKAVNIGVNAYFKYANENNLIKDKEVVFISYDDKYEPELTLENLNKLIFEDDVFALFGFVGTPTVKNILHILYNEDIQFFAPFTGASFLRNTKNRNLINFRSSYEEEIEKLISYLYEKKKLKKIAVFYQNDDFGQEGYVSLLKALKEKKLNLVAQGSYKRNTFSISHAFNEIKEAQPEAIIMLGTHKVNSLFIQKAKENLSLKDTIFCNISFSDANSMIDELKKSNTNTKNLVFSEVVPYYEDNSIQVVKQYQELMRKYYPSEKLDFISLEAFLASKILVDSIKKIKGNLTKKKLTNVLHNVSINSLEGLDIKMKNTQLLNKVYLFEYKNDIFRKID